MGVVLVRSGTLGVWGVNSGSARVLAPSVRVSLCVVEQVQSCAVSLAVAISALVRRALG
jgi:hypothetical protein